MKPKYKILIIVLVLAAAASAALVLLPFSDNLCVGYICFLTALAMMLRAAFAVAKKRIPGGYRRIVRKIWIAPASLVVSAAVLALQQTGVFRLPFEMHIVAQLAVLAAGAIKLLSIMEKKKRPAAQAEKPAQEVPADAANGE